MNDLALVCENILRRGNFTFSYWILIKMLRVSHLPYVFFSTVGVNEI